MSYVYILVSPKVKGVCKVGYTRRSPYDRASHISSNDGNIWNVYWHRKFNTNVMAQIVENHAFYLINRFRRPRKCNSEFFKISPEFAKDTLNLVYDEYISLPWAREDTLIDVRARDLAYVRLVEKNPNYFLDHEIWFWQHEKFEELVELKRNNPVKFWKRMELSNLE